MPFLRSSDLKTTPWKNGLGETTEVAVSPDGSGLGDFNWRVSMAKVANDGPFSIFPGIDRTLVVLAGEGIALAAADAKGVSLTSDDQPFTFPGDAPTHGRLLGGPILDLNVMTRRGRFSATVTRRFAIEPFAIETVAAETLVLCVGGAARIEAGRHGGTLDTFDVWRAPSELQTIALVPLPDALLYLIEIEAA